MTFEKEIKKYAKQVGIDLIGVTTAQPFLGTYKRLKKLKVKGYLSKWAESDLKKRCYPRLLMEDAQSLISIGISYHDEEEVNSEELKGKLARFARYEDYHHLLKDQMEKLISFIRDRYPEVEARIFVDTGPLVDREVAYRAGLGFFGKNAALINPEYGSFLALGEILLDIPLKPDQPLAESCGQCNLCLTVCPQQAIKRPGEIKTDQCLAHHTQEKGFLTDEIRKKLGNRLWGCDTCQEVCPYNRQAQQGQGIFQGHKLGKEPDLEQILNFSNRQYKEIVGDTAMAWRGKRTLQRNALINLGNSKDTRAIPLLTQALVDVRPIIRVTASWALTQIGGEKSKEILVKALKREEDKEVKKKLKKYLNSY